MCKWPDEGDLIASVNFDYRSVQKGEAVTNNVQIFAVGGGGFTHPEDDSSGDALLEDRLLALVGFPENLRIGYIGHASDDNPIRIDAFHQRFKACASTKVLHLDADATAAKVFLADLDILYVGGGTTTAMLAHWHKVGIADAILAAAHRGLVLAGVSAGAICWFSELLLGTAEDGYALHRGLGLLAGSACPHFSNELPRRLAYETYVANGHLAAGLAIDDGVAVHICDGVVVEIIRARGETANAYFVKKNDNKVDVQPLVLGHHLEMIISDERV